MLNNRQHEFDRYGFFITDTIFNKSEIDQLLSIIETHETVYAKRQLVNKHPEILELLLKNITFKALFDTVCGSNYFLSKAIYFNKPKQSNWFVAYHQDISISVKKKKESSGFSKWTQKQGQLGVIPPVSILERMITFRIHLDKTDSTNGALKIIKGSHKNGLIRIDSNFQVATNTASLCNVERGAIMVMKPLLLHASDKSTADFDRRVIHLEFCDQDIPMGWLEKKYMV